MTTLTQAAAQHQDTKYRKEPSEKQNPCTSISINKSFEKDSGKKKEGIQYIFKNSVPSWLQEQQKGIKGMTQCSLGLSAYRRELCTVL